MIKLTSFLLFLLLGCSSGPQLSNYPDAESKIPAIESKIETMKQGYLTHCLNPVLARDPQENGCSSRLFSLLDRRYGTRYTDRQANYIATDLFFQNAEREIHKILKTNSESRSQAKAHFNGFQSLLHYYKEMYEFKH